MPISVRQKPTDKKISAKASVLSRIVPIASIQTGVKLNIYGRGKTGKTRLACTFPKPLLLIGTEDGRKSVSTTKDAHFVRLQASSEMAEITAMLAGGKYKTAVLDNGGGLQDMILKEVLGLENMPVQKSWGMAERGDWMTTGTQWKERVARLLDLADRIGLHVVVIAHERNFNEETTSDIMLPSVGSALTPTVANWLNGACDYIGQAFIREQEVNKTVTIGGKPSPQKQKTGAVEYCLRVGSHPIFMTGFRVPEGAELPDVIVDPSFEKINQLIQG